MMNDVRKYVRAGLEALAPQGTEDLAAALLGRAQSAAEQLSSFASGFLEWSAEARASLLKELKELVARQVEEMGVATKEDVEALRRRLDRLEAAGAGTSRRASKAASAARTRPRQASTAGASRGHKAAPSRSRGAASRQGGAAGGARSSAKRATSSAAKAGGRRAGRRSGSG